MFNPNELTFKKCFFFIFLIAYRHLTKILENTCIIFIPEIQWCQTQHLIFSKIQTLLCLYITPAFTSEWKHPEGFGPVCVSPHLWSLTTSENNSISVDSLDTLAQRKETTLLFWLLTTANGAVALNISWHFILSVADQKKRRGVVFQRLQPSNSCHICHQL